MHKLFFPLPMTYAVIQLDVEGTLRGLASDAQALDEARALRPLKCLVYLHTVRGLYVFCSTLQFSGSSRQ